MRNEDPRRDPRRHPKKAAGKLVAAAAVLH